MLSYCTNSANLMYYYLEEAKSIRGVMHYIIYIAQLQSTLDLRLLHRYWLRLELIQEIWEQDSITKQLFDSQAKCRYRVGHPAASLAHCGPTVNDRLSSLFINGLFPPSLVHCQLFSLSSTRLCLLTSKDYSFLNETRSVTVWVALISVWFQ